MTRRADTPAAVALLLLLVVHGAAAGFDVHHDNGFVLTLEGRRAAEQRHPLPCPQARLVPEEGGMTLLDAAQGVRVEVACTADSAELTWSYDLPAPSNAEMTLRFPLTEAATLTVVHGARDRAPARTIIPPEKRTAEVALGLPRLLVVTQPDGSGLTIDTLPMGVWGLTGAAHDAQSSGMAVRLEPDAVVVSFRIAPAYEAWRATLRGKVVVYSRPLEYDRLHPWQQANYRYGFEPVRKIAFSSAPPPRKPQERQPAAAEPYTPERGWGWLEGQAAVTLEATGVEGAVYGSRAAGSAPAVFRVDIPAGHYYLTLNFGSATAATGPLTIHVNGEERLVGFGLEPGRFRALPLWVTSRGDAIDIGFSAAAGASWQVNALTLSAMGTLNEDYTLTRPWWRFEH